MAEEKKAAEAPAEKEAAPAASAQKPILFIALAVVNMLVVVGVGLMLYMGKKKEASKVTIDHVIQGEHAEQAKADAKGEHYVGKFIPLETFVINLAGSRGGKLAKINMEFEVTSDGVQEEIDKRKPQIRDIIIILLSSKSYEQISTRDGKEGLREDIRGTLNSFLTKGQIKSVYFTEFIFN